MARLFAAFEITTGRRMAVPLVGGGFIVSSGRWNDFFGPPGPWAMVFLGDARSGGNFLEFTSDSFNV